MSEKHRKHPKLKRPALGHYGRTEFAFLGALCADIHALFDRWEPTLSERHRTLLMKGAPGDFYREEEAFDFKFRGSGYDLVLTNGNHFPAARQVVFLDPRKEKSVKKRLGQLTDVAAVVRTPEAPALPEWLAPYVPANTPQIELGEVDEKLLPLLLSAPARPPLKALVLAGGKSQRMGADKARLVYRNGETEVARVVKMLHELGLEAHLSLREATDSPLAGVPVIEDRFLGLGPAGAIASAFLHDPEAAWLTVACDLPLLDQPTLEKLVAARDTRQYATAVKGSSKPFPEPLVALYEPRAYPRLLEFLTLGYACPRKLLINSPIATVELTDEAPLANANTPEERERILNLLEEI